MRTHAATAHPRPWFREPMVWMVISGPLVVVLASIVTVTLAIQNPDPVLDRQPAVAPNAAVLDKLSPAEREAVLSSLLPAQKGRNHVATPHTPTDGR